MADKNLNINIIAKDKSKQALSRVQGRLNSVKQSVFSLKGALIGIGAGAVVKSFVDVGREVESLGVRFKFLFGSAEEGSKAFDNLTKFAGKVPFSLEAISRASGNLAVVSKDADDLNRILEITGNVAAVTGLDFETTASQIQRSFAGGIASADIFREKGVRSLLGFKEGAKVSVDETVEAFEKAFSGDGRFANATKDLAQTLDGTLSMIGDKYFNFQKDVAEGFFDELKGEFGDLNTFLEANEQQIEDIARSIGENFAGALSTASDTIKKVAPAVKTIADALGSTITGFAGLPDFVKSVGLIGALLFGRKGAVALAGVSFLFDKVTDFIDEVKNEKGMEELLSLPDDQLKKSITSLDQLNELLEFITPRTEKYSMITKTITSEFAHQIPTLEKLKNEFILASSHAEGFAKMQSMLLEVTKNTIKEQEKHKTTLGHFRFELDKFNETYRTTNEVQEEASLSLGHFQFQMDKFNEKFRNNTEEQISNLQRFKTGFQDAMNENAFDGFQKAGETAFKSLKSTLTDFVITGKLDMKSFGDAVKRALIEALIGQAVQAALVKASLLFKSKAIKDTLINTFTAASKALAQGGIFGPILAAGVIATGMGFVNKIRGFADGGRPPVGRPSLVGERGPELFLPDSAGTIVPNDQLGGGTTNVSFNITTVDIKGFEELLTNSRGTIVGMINSAVNEQGRASLV